MARVWSEERKLELWLDVELAALEAWAELGTVPPETVAGLRERAKAPSPARGSPPRCPVWSPRTPTFR